MEAISRFITNLKAKGLIYGKEKKPSHWYEDLKKEAEEVKKKCPDNFYKCIVNIGDKAVCVSNKGIWGHYNKLKQGCWYHENGREVPEDIFDIDNIEQIFDINDFLDVGKDEIIVNKKHLRKIFMKKFVKKDSRIRESLGYHYNDAPDWRRIIAILFLFDEKFDKQDFVGDDDEVCWVQDLKGNYRIYIERERSEYFIGVKHCTDKTYNFLDKGRRRIKGAYLAHDLDGIDIDEDILPYELDTKILDRENYERLVNEKKREEDRNNRDKAIQDKTTNAIQKKINKVDKEPFTFGGATFYEQYIEGPDGVRVGGRRCRLKQFYTSKIDFDEKLDFIKVFNTFIETINCEHFIENNKYIFQIGNVRVKPSLTKGKEHPYATRRYINGLRINNGETKQCLMRAATFKDTKEYNNFLTKISKCSLRIKEILDNGLMIPIGNNYDQNRPILKFKLERKKNINHIKLDKKLIRVRDITSLLDLRMRHDLEVDKLLMTLRKSLHITEPVLEALIKEGVKEHLNAIKRSEELLIETVKNLKVTEKEIKLNKEDDDNNKYKAYIIKGKSGQQYAILDKDAQVYYYPEMKHICIVEGRRGQEIGKDAIVSRLLALANDEVTKAQIHTLKP